MQELLVASRVRQEQIEQEQRDLWESTRWLAMALLQPNLKRGTRLKPSDLITFPWERPKRPKRKQAKSELIEEILQRDGKA